MYDLISVENKLWVLSHETENRIYDFDFRQFFNCRQPLEPARSVQCVSRCGAFGDYNATYNQLRNDGIQLVNSPEQHQRASELSVWYPLIADLTPWSIVYTERPSGRIIAKSFRFPVFVKGSRQTSNHQKRLSIIHSASEFDVAMEEFASDPILQWQAVVVRELVPLRPVDDLAVDRIPSSFEFRTFWWKGELVGAGRYWWQDRRYDWSESERTDGLSIAKEAALRIAVPFLVVDIAMTKQGKWIVIECNDGQESGYAGVSPIGLWQAIIDLE